MWIQRNPSNQATIAIIRDMFELQKTIHNIYEQGSARQLASQIKKF